MANYGERALDCELLCLEGMGRVIDGGSSVLAEQAHIVDKGYPRDMVQGAWKRKATEIVDELRKREGRHGA